MDKWWTTSGSAQENPKKSWRILILVRKRGFEPLRYCYRQPLKLVRLPVPPLPRGGCAARKLANACQRRRFSEQRRTPSIFQRSGGNNRFGASGSTCRMREKTSRDVEGRILASSNFKRRNVPRTMAVGDWKWFSRYIEREANDVGAVLNPRHAHQCRHGSSVERLIGSLDVYDEPRFPWQPCCRGLHIDAKRQEASCAVRCGQADER
jgi:hypothetical protein